jgi:SAM-dependent methyltransferase
MDKPQNPDYKFSADEYKKRVNTPAMSEVYFRHFIQPLMEEALSKKGQADEKVKVLDMACGHAHAHEFTAALPYTDRLEITGLDLSADALDEARSHYKEAHPGLDIAFIEADAENDLPIGNESMDAAIAINAMAYKQAHMLKSVFNALKPGGKCVINYFIPSSNKAYMDFCEKMGCGIYERKLEVAANGRTTSFPLIVTDFSAMPDEKVKKLGAQSFFRDSEAIEILAAQLGFEVVEKKHFDFYSAPIDAIVRNDVYTFVKPSSDPDVECRRLDVNERVTDMIGEKP